jgi:hypothetical protein
VTIGRIKKNDVVHCALGGHLFWALAAEDATSGDPKVLAIRALDGRSIPAHVVKPRQVIGHWRQRKGSVC